MQSSEEIEGALEVLRTQVAARLFESKDPYEIGALGDISRLVTLARNRASQLVHKEETHAAMGNGAQEDATVYQARR